EARRKHVSFVYNDKLYVYGGIDRLGDYQSSFLIYDFATSLWNKQNTSGPKLKDPAAIAINGSIYIWGGRDKDLVNNRVMYQYNLQTNVLTSLATFESGLEQLNTPENPRVQQFCLTQDKLFLVSGKAKTSKTGADTFGQISYASAPLDNLSNVSNFQVLTLQTNVLNSNNKFNFFCDNEELYISAAYYSPGAFINRVNLLEPTPQAKVVTKQNKTIQSHTIQKVNQEIISIYADQNSVIRGFSSYVGNPSYKKDALEYVVENPSIKRVGQFLHFEYDLVSPKETEVFVNYGLDSDAIFENYFLEDLSISASGHVTHRLDWTKIIFTTQKDLAFKAYLTDENGGSHTIVFPTIDIINPLYVNKLSPTIRRSRYTQTNNSTSLFIFGGEYGDGITPNENLITFESYHFSQKLWKSLKEYYTEYTQYVSIAADNNHVYITGGSNGSDASHQFIKYDIASDSFSDLGGLPFLRFSHESVIYNQRLYLIGGSSILDSYGNGDDFVDRIDIYDLTSNQWLSSIQGIVSNVLDFELINDELYLLGVDASSDNLIQKIDLLTNKTTLLPNPQISKNLFSLGRIEDHLVATTKYKDHLQLYNIYSKNWVYDTVDLLKESFEIESSFGVSDSLYLLGTYDYFNQLDLYELKLNSNNGLQLTESSNRISGDFDYINNITSIQIQSSEDRGRTYVTTTVTNIDLVNKNFTYDFTNADVNRLLKLTIHTDQGESFSYDYDFLSSKKNINHCVSVDIITPSTLTNPSTYLTDVNVSVGENIKSLKLFQYVKGSTNSEKIYEITTNIARKNFTFSDIALTETTGSFSNHFEIITQTGCSTSHEITVNNESFQPNFQVLSVKNKTMFDLNSPYKAIKKYPTIKFQTDVPLKIKNVRAIYPFVLNGKELEDYKGLSYLEKSFAKPGTYEFVLTNGLVSTDLYLPFGEFYIEIQIEKLGDSSKYSRFKVYMYNGVVNEFVKFNMVH
ncbi:hypothetical protein MJH12_16750, partial [bacterium]|nr:hypothetical protein [bacterium]